MKRQFSLKKNSQEFPKLQNKIDIKIQEIQRVLYQKTNRKTQSILSFYQTLKMKFKDIITMSKER